MGNHFSEHYWLFFKVQYHHKLCQNNQFSCTLCHLKNKVIYWKLDILSSPELDGGMCSASPLTLSSPLFQTCHSSHTLQSAVAPQSLSDLDNGGRRRTRSALHNCFLSLLVCFLSEVMNAHRGLRCSLSSSRHFYETKILMHDLCRSARQERGQT